MNSRIYIHGALYITLLLVTCFCSVQGNVIYVRSEEGTLADFLYWDVKNWGPDDIMEGFVVESQPQNACDSIMHPPSHQTNSTFKWFALIQTNDCSMEVKLNMAENAGFDAVIAYPYLDDKNYLPHHYLSSDEFDSNLTIVAVRVTPAAGEAIKMKYQYPSGCYLRIVPDYPFNIFRYIIPFVIAVGICMMILMLFVIVKYIRERRRNQRNRLSSRHLKQLPVIKFKKGDQYDVCAICLEEYNEGNKLRVLPCSHAYHTKCIDPWLTNNRRTCPICKRKIRLDDESSDSESDSESEALTETTPLLRPLAGISRQRAPTSNFLRNPVINSNQPDVIVNCGMGGIENSRTAPTRSTLEQQAGLFLQHSVHIEPDNGESDNSSAYSSSAPPFHIATSTEDEQEALNQPSTSGEHTSSLPNVASSALHVEVEVENSRKEKTLKDMIV